MGFQRVVLVGCSLGESIVTHYQAREHPPEVIGLCTLAHPWSLPDSMHPRRTRPHGLAAGERLGEGLPPRVEKPQAMTTPRTLTLSDAAEVCGTTKKALERRVERGTLEVSRRGGVRVVEVTELVRVGLIDAGSPVQVPTGGSALDRPLAVLARRLAEADADLLELRASLEATEAALRRAREDARLLRSRLAQATPAGDLLAETA